jgi:hypothetical protein
MRGERRREFGGRDHLLRLQDEWGIGAGFRVKAGVGPSRSRHAERCDDRRAVRHTGPEGAGIELLPRPGPAPLPARDRRSAVPHRRGERRLQRLSPRREVVVRNPPRQPEDLRREDHLLRLDGSDGTQLRPGRFGGETHDVPVDAPRTEGDAHPVTDAQRFPQLGGHPVAEDTAQPQRDGDLRERLPERHREPA